MDFQSAYRAIIADPRYQRNLDWGDPRPGHPEGSIRAHIAQLERNLQRLRPRLTDEEVWKLKLLIHTHDTFKPDATPGSRISDPTSHASLAKAFLAEYCQDADLLTMVQFHDEPYALWQQVRSKGTFNRQRLAALIAAVRDWNLFAAFLIIDGCTDGKSDQPLRWLFRELAGKIQSQFSEPDILSSARG